MGPPEPLSEIDAEIKTLLEQAFDHEQEIAKEEIRSISAKLAEQETEVALLQDMELRQTKEQQIKMLWILLLLLEAA